jgi:hypothetical protein
VSTIAPATARRLDRWKLSLLDLTLRNRLLDARDGRQVLPLVGVNPVALQEDLADGAVLELGSETVAAVGADELDRRLIAMARSARESLQESGASTLWIALGVLRWFESDDSEVARHAPLALYPVELRRSGAGDRYRIAAQPDEDPRWNDTLFEKLRSEHGVEVPGREADDVDLAAMMATLAAAVAKLPRWQVLPEARLGIFSFTKFVMWTDLDARGEALLGAPVVAHLARGDGQPFPPQGALPDRGSLDRTLPLAEQFAPLDCDASQLAAVVAAAGGKTFVLQGPPGTGK